MDKKTLIYKGLRDGLPIGLGYYAVAFSLGIIAEKANIAAWLGFLSSFFTRASAGEYGGYTVILADSGYYEMILMCLITNLRYLLMNTALSQRFSPQTGMVHRLLVGSCCTDEIFGIAIAEIGYVQPLYIYTAAILSGIMWGMGTMSGIVAGSVLPTNVVAALSVALYGMFLAIVIPVAKRDKAVAIAIIVSFAASYIASNLPVIGEMSSGIRIIILTVIISAAAAIIKPVEFDKEEK
ncbi:MAG: AzlC family ABC transporter permease [Lachnospiraceae bacterium]|nr:AzlC family ABC transporter permease [Lachnospiraceae bacterium]